MRIERLSWLGVRTDQFDRMVSFLSDSLGLRLERQEAGRALFLLPNGDPIDVWDTTNPRYAHFPTVPVVGFLVGDVTVARDELEAKGVDWIGPVRQAEGFAWAHFRGPDGNLYELQGRAKSVHS
jgi:catechol 2,3-dioxygenase-like lactoylglutathione lyase family enzyme